MSSKFDVIIVDAVGLPFIGTTPEDQGLGGSESQEILLLEGLAAHGLKVLSLNNTQVSCQYRGVSYCPLSTLSLHRFSTKVLILERNTAKPVGIEYDRLVVWTQDTQCPENPEADLVTVSNWQSTILPGTFKSRTTRYNMLPDWVYDLPQVPSKATEGHYVYASAAIKGLDATLRFWQIFQRRHQKATLHVAMPGYDSPRTLKDIPGVAHHGALSFELLVELMRACCGMFYVCTFPETFAISTALAEALGLNLHILQIRGADGMNEVLSSPMLTTDPKTFARDLESPTKASPKRSYRQSGIVREWISDLCDEFRPGRFEARCAVARPVRERAADEPASRRLLSRLASWLSVHAKPGVRY